MVVLPIGKWSRHLRFALCATRAGYKMFMGFYCLTRFFKMIYDTKISFVIKDFYYTSKASSL